MSVNYHNEVGTAKIKAIARSYYEEMFNRQDAAFANRHLSPTFAFRDPSNPYRVYDREGLIAYISNLHTAFPDLKITITEAVAEGNKVAVEWEAKGTHRGKFSELEATGKQVRVNGMSMFHFKADKVEVLELQVDWLGLFRQLGLDKEKGLNHA
ncbi:MAG TPA: ester cyclase [Chloroflexia bacterium]|nr:ester cyclase [Chloroflexia bacterium]